MLPKFVLNKSWQYIERALYFITVKVTENHVQIYLLIYNRLWIYWNSNQNSTKILGSYTLRSITYIYSVHVDYLDLNLFLDNFTGRMVFRSEEIYQDVCRDKLIAVKYVDDLGKPTEVYPFNPNGSRDGIAAICSEDGRHLAIMPHPERCFLPWQCAWMPQEMRRNFDVSPWFKMFQNAFDWCREQ